MTIPVFDLNMLEINIVLFVAVRLVYGIFFSYDIVLLPSVKTYHGEGILLIVFIN